MTQGIDLVHEKKVELVQPKPKPKKMFESISQDDEFLEQLQ